MQEGAPYCDCQGEIYCLKEKLELDWEEPTNFRSWSYFVIQIAQQLVVLRDAYFPLAVS